MDSKTLKNTRIFEEHDNDFSKNWFKYKGKSFISHIDTLYFMVKPKCENWREDERKNRLFAVLRQKKESANEKNERVPIFEDIYEGLEVEPFQGLMMYSFNFALVDNFNIFVCEFPPNGKTPPIMVQLRSQTLWINGLKKSFDTACECVEKILGGFGIEIDGINENRIDYAFHTNYIQDLMSYFPEKKLKKMQISNFARWHKEGYFYQDELGCDYFTLGRRKSNNVFFRVYNKTQEVIEKGYKQFFIAMWLNEGLISKYDEYVLSRAFNYGAYFSKDKARCEFYCQYGKDGEIKREIAKNLEDPETPAGWYTKRAKGLVPDITLVCNVEFQTKRKFYDRLKLPELSGEETCRRRMYNIFTQLHSLIQFLTHDTVRFIKYKGKYADAPRLECPDADWWDRLRSTKPLEYSDEWLVDYFREYQYRLDKERQKQTSINKMARMAAYEKLEAEDDSTAKDDVMEFLSSLNDNDLKKYYKMRSFALKDLERKRSLSASECDTA